MLEWIGYPCIENIEITCRSDSPTTIVFIFADESINSNIICSDSASSHTFIDASGVRVDAGLPLLWCL